MMCNEKVSNVKRDQWIGYEDSKAMLPHEVGNSPGVLIKKNISSKP